MTPETPLSEMPAVIIIEDPRPNCHNMGIGLIRPEIKECGEDTMVSVTMTPFQAIIVANNLIAAAIRQTEKVNVK